MANYIYKMFGASPIRPLQQHMAKVQVCAAELIPFFEAVIAHDEERMLSAQQKIAELENEADSMKKEIRLNLPTGMFLAFSRRDLLDVLTTQDNIANKTKDIAGLALGRKLSLPEAIAPHFMEYIKRCVDASSQAQKAINELDELVETGFRGGEVKLVKKLIKKLNAIESDTDDMQIEIRRKLFDIEKDLPPVDVMFIYRIIEWIGDIADLAERVGSRLQLLLAK